MGDPNDQDLPRAPAAKSLVSGSRGRGVGWRGREWIILRVSPAALLRPPSPEKTPPGPMAMARRGKAGPGGSGARRLGDTRGGKQAISPRHGQVNRPERQLGVS